METDGQRKETDKKEIQDTCFLKRTWLHEDITAGDTEGDTEQIITEALKTSDVKINDYILVKFMSKRQHFYHTGQDEQQHSPEAL